MKKLIVILLFVCSGSCFAQKQLIDTFIGNKYVIAKNCIDREDWIWYAYGEVFTGDSMFVNKFSNSSDTFLVFKNRKDISINIIKSRIDDMKNDGKLTIIPESSFTKLQKRYTKKTFASMLEGNVLIGMSKEECILTWGESQDKSIQLTRFGQNEVWRYAFGRSSLFIKDGILERIVF